MLPAAALLARAAAALPGPATTTPSTRRASTARLLTAAGVVALLGIAAGSTAVLDRAAPPPPVARGEAGEAAAAAAQESSASGEPPDVVSVQAPPGGTGERTTGSAQDLTGDGLVDLIGRDAGGRLFRHDGESVGGFAAEPELLSGGWGRYRLLVVSPDLTGDAQPDIVAVDAAGLLVRHDGTAAGSFTAEGRPIDEGWETATAIVAPGDLGGDGMADLITRDETGLLWRWDGTGTGTLAAHPLQIGGGWNVFAAILTPGDLAGDGRADLLAVRTDGVLLRYDVAGSGFVAAGGELAGDWRRYTALVGADVDRDGHGDLLGRDRAGALYRCLGTVEGALGPACERLDGPGDWDAYDLLS